VQAWASAERAWPPWIFTHDTNIADKGLIVLFFGLFLPFFGLFSVAPPRKRLNSAIFGTFLLFLALFSFFSLASPLEIFLPTLLGAGLQEAIH